MWICISILSSDSFAFTHVRQSSEMIEGRLLLDAATIGGLMLVNKVYKNSFGINRSAIQTATIAM